MSRSKNSLSFAKPFLGQTKPWECKTVGFRVLEIEWTVGFRVLKIEWYVVQRLRLKLIRIQPDVAR